MRGGPADGSRFVGAVNSVARAIQSQPARPDRVAGAGGNHHAGVVVSRIGDAINDLEFSARTGANSCAAAVEANNAVSSREAIRIRFCAFIALPRCLTRIPRGRWQTKAYVADKW